MFKVFILSIVWLNIKSISLFFMVIAFLINKESNKILNQKFYKVNSRYTNYCIRPLLLDSIPDNMAIGTILYHGYWNSVFDLTYSKILLGPNYYWLKIFSLKKFITRLFFYYIGVNRFLLLIVFKIIKYDDRSLEDYLFKMFGKEIDSRLIVRVNNKWELNGGLDLFWQKLYPRVENKLSLAQISHLKSRVSVIYEKALEISYQSRTFNAVFVDNRTKVPHSVYPDLTKDSSFVGYQTSYQSAFNNDFYGLLALITRYQGVGKESTLLKTNSKDLIQVRGEKRVLNCKQLLGAIKNGYDENAVSADFKENTENLKEVKLELTELLWQSNAFDEIFCNEIFNYMITNVESDILEHVRFDKI